LCDTIWLHCIDYNYVNTWLKYAKKQYAVTNVFSQYLDIYYIQAIVNFLYCIVGTQLSMLEDTTVRSNSSVFDLHVYKDMLIVPRCSEKKVLFYQLNWTGNMYIVGVMSLSWNFVSNETLLANVHPTCDLSASVCQERTTTSVSVPQSLNSKFKLAWQSRNMCKCWKNPNNDKID